MNQSINESETDTIRMASRDRRLVLRRTVGPFSGGTPVILRDVRDDDGVLIYTVEGYVTTKTRDSATGKLSVKHLAVSVEVEANDLVIRRR
jgi:hypothetical protein